MASEWTDETLVAQAIGNNPVRAAAVIAAECNKPTLAAIEDALLARTDAEVLADLNVAVLKLKKTKLNTQAIEEAILALSEPLRPQLTETNGSKKARK